MYVGGKLAPWFDTSPNKALIRKIADRGGHRLTSHTTAKTPWDSGHLRNSWDQKPVLLMINSRGEMVAESGVETHVDYAPYVEWGTGLFGPKHAKYEIKPKHPDGWLRWIDPRTGLPVFAKRVMHPGSPGAHMVAIAVALVEHELSTFAQPLLLEWAKRVELQNPWAHPGRT